MVHIDIRIRWSGEKKHKKNKAALAGEQLCFKPSIVLVGHLQHYCKFCNYI